MTLKGNQLSQQKKKPFSLLKYVYFHIWSKTQDKPFLECPTDTYTAVYNDIKPQH